MVKGKWKGVVGDIYFVNIYGPHTGERKALLWNRLKSLMSNVDAAWCLFGDFNEVRRSGDRLNTQVNEKEAREFMISLEKSS